MLSMVEPHLRKVDVDVLSLCGGKKTALGCLVCLSNVPTKTQLEFLEKVADVVDHNKDSKSLRVIVPANKQALLEVAKLPYVVGIKAWPDPQK